MSFEIRLATVEDLPDLRACWRALMTELNPPYPVDLASGLNDFTRQCAIALTATPQTAFAFVAMVERQVVGFLLYEIQYRLLGSPKRFGFVHHCYVAPTHRHQGITNSLGEVMAEHMLAQNLTEAEVTHLPSEHMWERCGFIPFEIRSHCDIAEGLRILDHRRAMKRRESANGLDHAALAASEALEEKP